MSVNLRSIGAATAACSLTLVTGLAFGTGTASAAPTANDAAFVTANEQGNLAEISLGTLAMSKGQDSATKNIARKTMADHETAKSKLSAVASKDGATLPTTPNAMQQAVAAQLTSAPAASFDLMYAQAQVTAHEQAIAAAKTEQATTKDAGLKSYTAFYIPVATMHLQMAQAEVKSLGGTPTGVPAGSGGAASTNTSIDHEAVVGIGAGALLIAAGGVLTLRRRRSQV